MEKNRPTWQQGKLNGFGGGAEGESAIECMMREAKEETGLTTTAADWKQFATISSPDRQVHFFSLVYRGPESDIKTTTDEPVSWYDVRALPQNIVTNISWLVPLAAEKMQNDTLEVVSVTYR